VIDELRDGVRQFAGTAAAELDGLSETDAAKRALELLARQKLLGYCVPAAFGGSSAGDHCAEDAVSVRVVSAIRDELAYHSGMLDVMFVMQGLGSYAVSLAGSEARRATLLNKVANGSAVAAFALTEPKAGSALTDVSTIADRTSSGYRLSGHKTFISNAPIADFFTLLARTSGKPGDKDGLSMFLIPGSTRGLEIKPFEVMAPHPIGEVLLNDVTLPEDALLGEEGGGLELALSVLARFRTSVAAAANGFARRALDEAVKRLAAREQFGRPLATFQGLRFDIAEMDMRLRAAQLLVAEAAEAVDAGGDHTRAVARAKLYATETASWVCDRAVQHFGGLGVKRGEIVERLFREVRALRIYEGASEVQKLILAKSIFDAAK